MLIDCGNKSTGYDFDVTADYLENYLPDGKLDYLMLTHSDEDHVEYMSDILELYEVSNIFMPDILAEPSGTSAAAEELRDEIAALDPEKLAMFDDEDTITTQVYARFFVAALSEPNCEIVLNVDPDENTNSIVITDGKKQADGSYAAATYMLTFYCPTAEYYAESDLSSAEEKNAVSPIGILEYNDVRIVLTGDSNEINEPTFVERIDGSLDCDVLKVGHHGSETSSTEAFLDAINCEYAVISCNADGNTFYHPRQNTLDRFIADDMTIYRTDNNGNIVLTVDENGEMKFTLERLPHGQQRQHRPHRGRKRRDEVHLGARSGSVRQPRRLDGRGSGRRHRRLTREGLARVLYALVSTLYVVLGDASNKLFVSGGARPKISACS